MGQPFDTIKVRMQSGENNTARQFFKELIKNEGILALYKGSEISYSS